MARNKKIKWTVNENGCWLCISHTPNNNGYPKIMIDGFRDSIHRQQYRIYKGEIPKGILVRHTCDVKICINPSHLIIGTSKENTQDCIMRGRFVIPVGEKCGRSKIKDSEAEFIRKNPTMHAGKLSDMFGISKRTVHDIRNGKTRNKLKYNTIARREKNQ